MKPGAGVLAIALLAPLLAPAQDLPPGVLLLSQIKRHLKQQFSRLPDYTCLETAQRLHKSPGTKSAVKSVDVLRLEVLSTGKHEMYAAPGETDFREDSPFAFSASGLAASGLFAGFLQTLFIHDNAMFTWRGEESGQPGSDAVNPVGRRTVRYDYRVPVLTSGWHVQLAGAGGDVAMKGSIWIDAETRDLLRLKVQADDIPASLEVSDITILLDYARTRIGEVDVLLPQTGELSMLHTSTELSRNILEYTHCRSFQTQSTVSFVDSKVSFDKPALPPSPPRRAVPLPAGLTVTVRLSTPISEKLMLGTLLEGTVASAVMDRGRVILPAGSRVTGRLRRLDANEASTGFNLGLEFTEIQTEQSAYRFYADLQAVTSDSTVETIPDETAGPMLPGVGFIFVRGSRFTLGPGFRLTWKTRAPGR